MGADLIVGYLEYPAGMNEGDPYDALSELRARICALPDDDLLRVAEHRWGDEPDDDPDLQPGEYGTAEDLCARARNALHDALGVFCERRRDVSHWRDRIFAGGTSWGVCDRPMPWASLWEDDAVQFPRLIAECEAAVGPPVALVSLVRRIEWRYLDEVAR